MDLLVIDSICLHPKWSAITKYHASSSMTSYLVRNYSERLQDRPNVSESVDLAKLKELLRLTNSSFESIY